MASVRKRKRAGKDVWVVDYRDPTGKRRLRTFATFDEAKLERASVEVESRQATDDRNPDIHPNITVGDYAEIWLPIHQLNIKQRSFEQYRETLNLHIKPTVGYIRVRQVTSQKLITLLRAKLDAGLRRSSVKSILSVVRLIMTAAIDDGLIRSNPANGLIKKLGLGRDPEKLMKKKVKALSGDELARFLDTARQRNQELYPLFFLLARSGLRPGEAYALHWEDINFGARTVTVNKTLHRIRKRKEGEPAFRVGITKTSEERFVDMTEQLCSMLQSMYTAESARALEQGTKPVGFIFTHNGQPHHESRVRDHIIRLLKRAAVPGSFHPHCLGTVSPRSCSGSTSPSTTSPSS